MNIGLVKEKLIATKTMNSFIAGFAQIGSYVYLGALEGELWIYGAIIGLGAIIGNLIGKKFLKKISELMFRRLLIISMTIAGITMIIKGLSSYLIA